MDPSSSSSLVLHSSSYNSESDQDYYSCDDDDDEPLCSSKRPKNDVFLNYSSQDIGIVSHLKGALKRNGFAISDHTTLPIGHDESSELLKAIQDSEIYVVVLSANYASSVKCLDELVLIMDSLIKFKKRRVFPIFYHVDPSHVRSQKGSFLEAFHRHDTDMDPERVQNWRDALKDVGQRSGQTLQNGVDEADILSRIVEELEKMQSPQDLHVTDHHVGLGSRVEELISELRLACDDVLVVAVFGISGIGKTEIVKATYNRIATDFDVRCFLDIHDFCGNQNWKVQLQKELISRLTQNDKPQITHHNDGLTKIRNLTSRQKILLVLDDVDKFQQLEALGIDPARFYNGSRIIVTTRDKTSLGNIKYVCYHTKLLIRRESLNLFTRLMFSRDEPVDEQFVEEIVRRAGGLPLVLEVWSRHFKCRERKQWPRILEKLRRIPHEDVQKKLQVSYDSLDKRAKNLFLDIACFFDGMDTDLVIKVLEDEENAFPDIEIQDLIDKGLVEDNKFRLKMHDVIREMGREVVRQENEDDPGQRSRLVGEKDVVRVLRDCSGTDSIRSICLYGLKEEEVTVQVEAFRKMSNLRFIKFSDTYYNWKLYLEWSSSNDDMSTFSFKRLKYLECSGFPFKCLDKFDMGNVVVIELKYSKLEILWEGGALFKSLKKLRILHVRNSLYLTRTGSFIGLENLEELWLDGCENLEELDSSIGCLQKLVILSLCGCKQLKRVPWEMIDKLTSLVSLDICGCKQLKRVPWEIGNLKLLSYLNFGRNQFHSLPDSLCQLHQLSEIGLYDCDNLKSIPSLPPNIQHVNAIGCSSLLSLPSNMSELQFLTRLFLNNCKELGSEGFVKVTGLRNLEELSMANCNVSQVSSEIGNLASLKYLFLSGNTFSSLPDSISNLSRLEVLEINDCCQLELLPLLPSNLREIEAGGCGSLDVMPYDSRQMGYIFRSQWCRQLLVNSGTEEEEEEEEEEVVNSQLEPSFTSRGLIILLWEEEEEEEDVIPPHNYINLSHKREVVIPGWCSYTSIDGEDLCFVAPITTTQLDKKICGVIFYAYGMDSSIITMLNKTKGTRHQFNVGGSSDYSVCFVGLYRLNDETLVVEAGDTLLIQYAGDTLLIQYYGQVLGLSLIYEDDVVDNSAIFVRDVNGVEPPTTLLNDEVCIFHTTDNNNKSFFKMCRKDTC